jgi:6-phosphogluconolactonase
MMNRRFAVLPDGEAVAEAAANHFVAIARSAIRRRGVFRAALSGGRTPLRVYPWILAPSRVHRVDWSRAEFFFGDERTVPSNHPDSNYGCARNAFLDQLPGLRADCVYRMPTDARDLPQAAVAYELDLSHAFGVASSPAPPPAFDLVWLGMGRDGHTASLFPGSSALDERRKWVVVTWAPSLSCWRMTFTLPLINAAREAMFVAVGTHKAGPLLQIHSGSSELPAARVHARRTLWIVDEAAAGESCENLAPAGGT